MRRLCIRLLERFLPADFADHVIGDLLEQKRSTWWLIRQTIAALIQLRGREQPGDGIVRTFLGDMRLAARQLRRAPAFTAAAVITLGLAIGATAAIFSVIDPVLLRRLPYPGQERLVAIWERDRDGGRSNVGFSTALDLGTQSTTIERWAAAGSWEPTIGDTDAERVSGDRVSWTYFRTLGVQPAIGRDFLVEEDQPGKNRVVILSHRLWQRRFNGDSSIVGRTMTIDAVPYHVAGVMPASFDNVVAPRAQIWRVLGYSVTNSYACRTCRHLRMIARIKPTATLDAARAELDGIHANIIREHPKDYASVGMSAVRMQNEVTRNYRPTLLALGGAVLLLLLIAVANVVNLQLARAVRRQEEFAIRVALGAGRWRLKRQLLAEGLVLAGLGGIAGAVVTWVALPILISRLPSELPRLSAIQFNFSAAALIAVTVMTLAVIMSLVTSGRREGALGDSLRAAKRMSTGGQHVTRSALVVAEVSLAVMLLVSAGLVARSLVKLLSVDAGFDAKNLLTMEVNAVGPRYPDSTAVFAFHDRVREAVHALPGVAGVAITNQVPLGGNVDMYGVIDADNPPTNPELSPNGDRYVVSTDYFEAMRIPILAGRAFTAAENRDSTTFVALVSKALATRMWPGQDPIGKRFRVGGPNGPIRAVIGVTGDVRHDGLDAVTTHQWYAPERQWFGADYMVVLVVRAKTDAASLAPAVRKAIASIDPTAPVINIATMDQLVAVSTAQRQLALVLFAAFATAALLLAVAGIYGVLAGNVAERTREIGLRSALGATPREIVALVVRQGGLLAVSGIVIGLVGALAFTRYLSTFLFGVEPTDPTTLAAVVGVLVAVTLAACAIPAARAVRIDPSEALRYD